MRRSDAARRKKDDDYIADYRSMRNDADQLEEDEDAGDADKDDAQPDSKGSGGVATHRATAVEAAAMFIQKHEEESAPRTARKGKKVVVEASTGAAPTPAAAAAAAEEAAEAQATMAKKVQRDVQNRGCDGMGFGRGVKT